MPGTVVPTAPRWVPAPPTTAEREFTASNVSAPFAHICSQWNMQIYLSSTWLNSRYLEGKLF